MIANLSHEVQPLIRSHQSFRPILVFGMLLSMISGSITSFEPKSVLTYKNDNLVGTMLEDHQNIDIDDGMPAAATTSTTSTTIETDKQLLFSNDRRGLLRSSSGSNGNQEERGLQSCSTCYTILHEDPYCASGSVADTSQFDAYYKYYNSAPDTSCIYACCQSFEKDCCISTGDTDDSDSSPKNDANATVIDSNMTDDNNKEKNTTGSQQSGSSARSNPTFLVSGILVVVSLTFFL